MKEINCLGRRCPLPIIETAKAIKELHGGDCVRLFADDPATEIDLRAWARMTGNQMKVIAPTEFLITKAKVD